MSQVADQLPYTAARTTTEELRVLQMLRDRNLDFSEEQIQILITAVMGLPGTRQEYVDTRWLAERSGLTRRMIAILVSRGQIPAAQTAKGRQGSRIRVLKSEAVKWLARR